LAAASALEEEAASEGPLVEEEDAPAEGVRFSLSLGMRYFSGASAPVASGKPRSSRFSARTTSQLQRRNGDVPSSSESGS